MLLVLVVITCFSSDLVMKASNKYLEISPNITCMLNLFIDSNLHKDLFFKTKLI